MDELSRPAQVLQEIVANRGTYHDAMVKSGYSEAYASNPAQLQRTEQWAKLLADQGITKELLAKRHLELLNKRETAKVFMHDSGEFERVVIDQPDTNAVKAGLDMGYKLYAAYPTNNVNSLNMQQNNILVLPGELIEEFNLNEVHSSTSGNIEGQA